MAILNKTGITNGGTIQAEHVTRTIDALTGGSTDTIVATGSFTGSFTGPLTGTASFATSASRAVSSSFATTASYALNAGSGVTQDTFYVQFSHDNLSGIAASSTKYYPQMTGDISVQSGSGKPVDTFMITKNCSLVSMSISAYNAAAGGGEGYRMYIENYTTKVSSGKVDVVYNAKTEATLSDFITPVTFNEGDEITYSLVAPSGMPTGSYLRVLLHLKS